MCRISWILKTMFRLVVMRLCCVQIFWTRMWRLFRVYRLEFVGVRILWYGIMMAKYTAKFGYFRALENISMAFFHLRGVQYGISWSFECVLESFVGIILYIFCYLCGKSCLMMILSCLLWFSGLFGRIEMLMFMGRGSCNLQTSCKRQVCG